MRNGLVLALICTAAIAMPDAADSTAWFGTPVPPPLSDPRKPVMNYDDAFAPLPAQFAHHPGKFDELLDGAALKADQKIVGSRPKPRCGRQAVGRRAANARVCTRLSGPWAR